MDSIQAKGCHKCRSCRFICDCFQYLDLLKFPLDLWLQAFLNGWPLSLVLLYKVLTTIYLSNICSFLYAPIIYWCVIGTATKETKSEMIRNTKSMIAVILRSLPKIVRYVLYFAVHLHKLHLKSIADM